MCSLFWTKNPNFGPKNADIIKYMRIIQNVLHFLKVLMEYYVCQKLAVKRYPIKI